MRYKTALLIAIASAAVGLLLIFPFSGDGESFAFGVSSPDETLPALLFMTTERTVGVALVWIATLLIASVIGHQIATSHTPQGD